MPGESVPKNAKTVPTAGKATIFWELKGIIPMDFLEKGRTITGQYYSKLFFRLDEKLEDTRPHLAKKVRFHQDKASTHSSGIVAAKLHKFPIRNFSPLSNLHSAE